MTTFVSILISHLTKMLLPVYDDHNAAQASAWLLLEQVTGFTKARLIAMHEVTLNEAHLEELLRDLVEGHKPIQYILGTVPFLDITLAVKQPVLIPRPETEWWCGALLDLLEPYVRQATPQNPFLVLDLCTGSGCIALAIASRFKNYALQVTAVDLSDAALLLARENAQKNDLTEVSFIKSDLYNELGDKRFDLIVANPPYISPRDYQMLDRSVRDWEDKNALVAQSDGYELIERIIKEAPQHLRSSYSYAQLWCEIGASQGAQTFRLFTDAGFDEVAVVTDQYDKDRVVHGTYPKNVGAA
jgi:release factor glutamine methyltransferase